MSQGDPANPVFYVQRGKVKVTVVSEQGKEAVTAILGEMISFVKAALPDRPCASQQADLVDQLFNSSEKRLARLLLLLANLGKDTQPEPVLQMGAGHGDHDPVGGDWSTLADTLRNL